MVVNLDREITERLRIASIKRIVDYISKMCGKLVSDRTELPNNEEQIRSILLENYIKNKTFAKENCMEAFRFDPEIPENYSGNGTYKGRVDIRVMLKSDFSKNEAYYIIECKRINGERRLNNEYVENGIRRFITGYYSSYYLQNIMLGFVVEKINIRENAQKIERIQNKQEIEYKGKWIEKYSDNVVLQYTCKHENLSTQLCLWHIFADFSEVIQKKYN